MDLLERLQPVSGAPFGLLCYSADDLIYAPLDALICTQAMSVAPVRPKACLLICFVNALACGSRLRESFMLGIGEYLHENFR